MYSREPPYARTRAGIWRDNPGKNRPPKGSMLAFYRQYAYFRYGYKNSTIMKPHLTNCLWAALTLALALSACGGRTSTLSVTVEGDGWSKLKTDSMNLT